MTKKVGIMGGTFNPIHFGHLLLAEQAKEVFHLDEILFIPSGNPYMKESVSVLSAVERSNMVKLAIVGHPDFHLSTIEAERTGPSYTCDTIMALKNENPQTAYYFIMGADSLISFEQWKNPQQIIENCTIAVAVRGTGTEEKIQKIAAHLIYEYQADIRILPARFIDISSSEIRQRISDKKSIRYMLPENIREYIYENHLYHSG